MTAPNTTTALLVMDVQPGITDLVPDSNDYLARLQSVIDTAHARHIQVIYRVLTTKVFPRQATVSTGADWLASIENG